MRTDQKIYAQERFVSTESEAERFKRERVERIKGNKITQSIRMEEEVRRARDLARAKQRKEEVEANKARLKNEKKSIAVAQDDKLLAHIVSEGSSVQPVAHNSVLGTASKGQKSTFEASRLKKEKPLEAEENKRLHAEAEQQEVTRLQTENNEQLFIKAEQQEVARLQAKEEERERIESERQEAARLLADDNERRLVEAKQKEAARLQAEMNLRQRIITENSLALKKKEENKAHLQSSHNSGLTVRPGSTILKNRRRQTEEKEGKLRGLMRGASASWDDESVSSASTYQSMEISLVSHSRNLSSGKNLQWEDASLFICFGLLTTLEHCPKEGAYHPNKGLPQKHILRSIMKKVKKLSKSVIEERSGNLLMKCQQPFVTSVKREESFKETSRPGVVRSFVRATIPLKITDVHEELNNTSRIVAKVVIRQALIEGIHNGYFAS